MVPLGASREVARLDFAFGGLLLFPGSPSLTRSRLWVSSETSRESPNFERYPNSETNNSRGINTSEWDERTRGSGVGRCVLSVAVAWQRPAMWAGLGLALILCFLPGGGTEHLGHCKEPPEWNIGEENPMMNSRGSASRLGDLQLKLASNGMVNISFIVVNHQGNSSQLKYQLLREKVPEDIPVYQQNATELDVWTTLRGKKDDFLIYDRCGRLVYHLGLPVSFLSFPFVEKAIQITYCKETCGNCSYTTSEIEEICKRIWENPEEKQIEAASSASQLSPIADADTVATCCLKNSKAQFPDIVVESSHLPEGDKGSCWQTT
ncbi:selenoprotein P [Crotalus adamanteus]|uniref:Selenoprotein P n=1 Tax=Crotalus adamanteus TaxID=8729 RepID=A0AAW1C2J2_CROAD